MVPTSAAHAQSKADATLVASVGSGWGKLWDDETNLGRGAPIGASVAVLFAGKLRAGLDLDWTSHVRDSGYLRAEGKLLGTFARVSYLAAARDARIRPSVGVGIGVLHSTGTLITRSTVVGPDGRPLAGPEDRRAWSLTRPAFDLHGGVRLRVSEKLAVRPEGRWRATFGSAASPSIEPPLINIQTMVLLDISL